MSPPRPPQTVLAVRLDSVGDVLIIGPAVRAMAAGSDKLIMLCGPQGAPAARLLPGVDQIVQWEAPWIAASPPAVDPGSFGSLVRQLSALRIDRAVIFTSFHQSALPTALMLRLAGIAHVAAISEDYPGSLLDVRHRLSDDLPEAERALSLARASGFTLPPGDEGLLRVNEPLPDVSPLLETLQSQRYVVVHPGCSAPARTWPPAKFGSAVQQLIKRGRRVVVTGSASERQLTATVADGIALDLGGKTELSQTAAVLKGAQALVVGNTGPAHLAAAVGTPVVSLFAPTVPSLRWSPYRVPTVLLGDQDAPCAGSRAVHCPVPGHPCLNSVTADQVVRAVEELAPV